MLKCGWGCGITFVPNKAEYGEFTLTGDFKDDPVRLDDRSSDGWHALAETLLNEQRFRRLNAQQPEVAEQLWKDAAADLQKRYDFLAQLAGKAEKSGAE